MFGGDSPKHISCENQEIAPIVVMSGDPLRAKYIARTYLTNAVLVSNVRNMLVFTGEYKGTKITVMGHGMGMPSMSIYAYELFRFFDVEKIVRIGTCGAVKESVDVLDVVVAKDCYTESNFPYQYDGGTDHIVATDQELSNKILAAANKEGIKVHFGTVATYDCFGPYVDADALIERIPKIYDVLVEEMEAYALAYIARKMNRSAAVILTTVDSKYSTKVVSVEDREKSLDEMIIIALEAVIL